MSAVRCRTRRSSEGSPITGVIALKSVLANPREIPRGYRREECRRCDGSFRHRNQSEGDDRCLANGRLACGRRGRRALPTASHLRIRSPQTHIVEGLSEIVKAGEPRELRVHQRRVRVRRAVVGNRRFGGGSAHLHRNQQPGLLFMAEAVYNAAGLDCRS